MRKIKIGLIGVGMFGGDVHLRTYADIQRSGLAPWLGRIGMDGLARELADVEFELVGVATRTEDSAKRAQANCTELTGSDVVPFHGQAPWLDMLERFPDLDLMAIATPDNLHTPPTLAALERGVHVVVEKPMCLYVGEADRAIELAKERNLVLGVDMHKRYDPDHLKIFKELLRDMGDPLYGRAVLEEPLEVSTKTFRWATQSDPFTYVGVHWTDLFIYYLNVKPLALFAIGQKKKLSQEYDIDAYDAVQVSVIFDNGTNICFFNNWITPPDFESNVNQESDIVCTRGKVESDSQYRGLRYYIEGEGMKTANTHFTRDIARADGSRAYLGYGKDSLVACLQAIAQVKFMGQDAWDIRDTHPNAEEARLSVAIIQAARIVRDKNFDYVCRGIGAPVTASFGSRGIVINDPYAENDIIYDKPI